MPFAYSPGNFVAVVMTMLGWLGFAVVMLTSRRANPGEASSRTQRDSTSMLGIAVQGLGIAFAWFGPIQVLISSEPPHIAIGLAIGAIAVASALLFAWAARTMGANWALVARTRGDHRLIETGPFGLTRNPIYVALFGMMVSVALAFGHASNLVVCVPLFVVGTVIRVRAEERLLRAAFGPAYDAYAHRVKRFIPYVL